MKAGQSGFTLVELVVASAILALVAVLGWRGLDTLVHARDRIGVEMEQLRRTQLAFAQIEADCAQLADAEALGGRTVLWSEGDRVVLLRMLRVEGQPVQLQVVRYRLQGGMLLRAASVGTRDVGELDMLWQGARSGAAVLQESPLQAAITGMVVRAWNSEGGTWRNGANVAFDAPPGRPRARPLETGLELTLSSSHGALRKVFMLGAG
jgi:general secretion pathway protein J